MKRFTGYVLALVAVLLITAVAFEAPQAVNAQGKGGGRGENLADRIDALELALALEVADREAGDAALGAALAQEVADREAADQNVITLLGLACQMIQSMAGNPTAEVIAICGDLLFKTVFVTSGAFDGDTDTGAGGLAGADDICNAAAMAASLAGTYTAWLSDSVTDARDRVTQATIPYVRTDGVRIAVDLADVVNWLQSLMLE